LTGIRFYGVRELSRKLAGTAYDFCWHQILKGDCFMAGYENTDGTTLSKIFFENVTDVINFDGTKQEYMDKLSERRHTYVGSKGIFTVFTDYRQMRFQDWDEPLEGYDLEKYFITSELWHCNADAIFDGIENLSEDDLKRVVHRCVDAMKNNGRGLERIDQEFSDLGQMHIDRKTLRGIHLGKMIELEWGGLMDASNDWYKDICVAQSQVANLLSKIYFRMKDANAFKEESDERS
jgi:hypothetical protein